MLHVNINNTYKTKLLIYIKRKRKTNRAVKTSSSKRISSGHRDSSRWIAWTFRGKRDTARRRAELMGPRRGGASSANLRLWRQLSRISRRRKAPRGREPPWSWLLPATATSILGTVRSSSRGNAYRPLFFFYLFALVCLMFSDFENAFITWKIIKQRER